MIKNQVDIDTQQVKIVFNDFNKFFSDPEMKELLTDVASFGKLRILKRTAKGKDVNGEFFKSYSPSTVFFRQRKGRPTDKVDLFFTGKMFGSLTIKADSKKSVLYFPPSESKKALRHQLGIGVPKRNFFGINADDLKKIYELVDGKMDEVLHGNK